MEAHEATIFYLAQIYGVPICTDDAGNQKVESLVVKEALLWAREKLSKKTPKELSNFKNCVQDGFLSTTNKPFPLRIDLNQAYELCFTSRLPEPQEKYIPLSEIRPQLNLDYVKDVEPQEFDFLKYLREEAALRLTKGPNAASDILYKRYGFNNMAKVGKWKGEYNYDNCIETTQCDKVDWLQAYKEHPPKETNNEKTL